MNHKLKVNNATCFIKEKYDLWSDKMISGNDFLSRKRVIKMPIKNLRITPNQKCG